MDVGVLTELIKQLMGGIMGLFRVSTETGREILKFIDMMGSITAGLLDFFGRFFRWIGSLITGG